MVYPWIQIYIYIYTRELRQPTRTYSSLRSQLFEALKLIRIIYTVLMQNRSCFTRKQTCNGEYTKHCTRSRHQLKMATPAEVSKRRSNFRIRQFKEKRLFNIAANLTLNPMASFVILLIARTARIACSDRYTYIHTYRHTHTHEAPRVNSHTRNNYCNPLCACASRVTVVVSCVGVCLYVCMSVRTHYSGSTCD